MTSGLNKVEARVDAVVDNLLAVDAGLLLEVRIESRLDVVEDGLPAAQMAKSERQSPKETARTAADAPLIVVHKVTETRGVDDSQAESHSVLFNICGNKKPRVRRQMGRAASVEEDAERRTSTDALDGDGLGPLCAGREGFLGRIEGGVKKSVDEGRLAEARLACRPEGRVRLGVLRARRGVGERGGWWR